MKTPILQLADVVTHPETVSTLPAEDIPDILGEIETVKARLWARLTLPNGTGSTAPVVLDRRLSVAEVAQKLGVSIRAAINNCASL